MHAHFITIIVTFCITLIRAATIAQIATDNEVLTKLAITVDAAVVEITVKSGIHAAQQIPHDLYSLTKALAMTGYNDTCNGTQTTSDPDLEDVVTQSYGLFTNTIEELMFDLSDKESTLACYNQRDVTYKQILYFNSTFVKYSTLMQGVVGDVLHQNWTRKATANAMIGIVNATGKYAPGRVALLLEA